MGKGDKSTKRGKISAGSYGNARPKSVAKPVAAAPAPARPASKAARKKV